MDPKTSQSTRPASTHITPKMALLGLGGIAAIIAIIIIFSFRSSESSQSIDTEIQNPAQDTNQPTIQPTQKSVYKDEFMTIDYPDNWIVDEKTLTENQGKTVTFTPRGNESFPPSYSVSYETTSTTIEERITLLEGLGFKRSAIAINNIPFIHLYGVAPFRSENGQIVDKPIQEAIYLARLNNMTVIIKYVYDGQSQDPKLEKIFTDLIANTHFGSQNQ